MKDDFTMASSKTRLAIIVSQETFENQNNVESNGNEHDVETLKQVLDLYGFNIREFKDQKKSEILENFSRVTTESHSNTEYIVVFVLTHGGSAGILFAKDEEFYTKDVWGPFRDCDALKDIPKVFIFQACRGHNDEKRIPASSASEDPQKDTTAQIVETLPHKSAFLFAHCSIADHMATRNHYTGTTFIQTLCNELKIAADQRGEIDFLSMLTEVNSKVVIANEREGKSQTSIFTSFLRHPLVFRNGADSDQTWTHTTSNVNQDAAKGTIETSYADVGTRLLLILYTKMFENEVKKLNKFYKGNQHFNVQFIPVDEISVFTEDVIRNIDFENACSLTVILLAELYDTKITDYCETLCVKFSTSNIHLNAVWSPFTASRCEHLRRKPKLFFFCDLLQHKDDVEENKERSLVGNTPNIESVKNHSDFLWAYCYGKKMYDELNLALLNSHEEITQLLTTAMQKAETSTCSSTGKISYFESTLRRQFFFHCPPLRATSPHPPPEEEILPHAIVDPIPESVASTSQSTDSIKSIGQDIRTDLHSIITTHELADTIEIINLLQSTTTLSIVTKYKKKLEDIVKLLKELDISDPALKKIHQERECHVKEIEQMLQKLKLLSQPPDSQREDTNSSEISARPREEAKLHKEGLKQEFFEQRKIILKNIDTFDDVSSSENYLQIMNLFETQGDKLEYLGKERILTDIEVKEARLQLNTAQENLKQKAMDREELNKKLQEKYETIQRDRKIIEENVTQNLTYLKMEVTKFTNQKDTRQYPFFRDQLIKQMQKLDSLECKDENAIRHMYADSIAKAQRVLDMLEKKYSTNQHQVDVKLSIVDLSKKLVDMNTVIDSLPEPASMENTQYQHLKLKLHHVNQSLMEIPTDSTNKMKKEQLMKRAQETSEKLQLKLKRSKSNYKQITSGTDTYKKPLQLLILDEEGKWKLDEQALSSVVCQENVRNRRVVVLSVIGKFRRGKSFLLTFMLRYLSKKCQADWLELDSPDILKGFEWRRHNERVTEGIIIWPEAFILGDYAVILLDTEGTSDPKYSLLKDTFMFSISSLVSSIQVLNIQERFELDDLINMKGFVEYGKSFAKKSENKKIFQKFLILIRDWKYPECAPYGYIGGMKLWHQQSNIQEELIAPVKACYENVKCFLMPRPGQKVENSVDFKGEIKDVDPCFLKHMKTLVEGIFHDKMLLPKRVGPTYITAKDLVHIMRTFVTEIQLSATKPESLLEVTVQLQFSRLLDIAAEDYKKYLVERMGSSSDIKKLNDDALTCVQKSIVKENFIGKTKSIFEGLLQNRLKDEYMRVVQPFLDERERDHKEKLRSTLENVKLNYESEMIKCLLSDEFHNFLEVNDGLRETTIRTFSDATGYIEKQFLKKIWAKGKSYFSKTSQSIEEYNNLLNEFNLFADGIYSRLLLNYEKKLEEKLEFIVNEATVIYRKKMKKMLKAPLDSTIFAGAHDHSKCLATTHLRNRMLILKNLDEKSPESEKLKERLNLSYIDFKERNKEKLCKLLENIKHEALEKYDNEMESWMSKNNVGFDEQTFIGNHNDALTKALTHFGSCNLDNTDPSYVKYVEETEKKIEDKMARCKKNYIEIGKPRIIQMAIQKYENIIDSHGKRENYIIDLETKNKKAKQSAIQYISILCDNSEEIKIEAKQAIEKSYKLYVDMNNSRKFAYFESMYSKVVREMEIELYTMKDKIRHSWQKNVTADFNEIAEKCLKDVFNIKEETEEYKDALRRSKRHIDEISKELEQSNNEKRENEMKRSKQIVQEAIQAYTSTMKYKISTLQRIPKYEDIIPFHVPAKTEALKIFKISLTKLNIDVPSELQTSLEKDIEASLLEIIVACNVDRKKEHKIQGARFTVGIDLGTTYSCVAVHRDNAVEIIKNSYNNYTTPSVVYFGSNDPIVGEGAVCEGQTDERNCISGVKRIIGHGYCDPEVLKMKKNCFFDIVNRNGRPHIITTGNRGTRCLKVEEVSAEVLKEMKEIAYRHLGFPVEDAVVTVPAYFNSSQRKSTLQAAEIAGLNVLNLLNEPTAAAFAFGDKFKSNFLRRVLVFDFGGGTCDVSIVEIINNRYDVKASYGNNTLGGQDFDQRVFDHVLKSDKLAAKALDDAARSRIKLECERLKRILSSEMKYDLYLPHISGSDLRLTISRETFETINLDLFKNAMEVVEKSLDVANLTKNEIDEVVLAGGSSHIPKVKELLRNFFNGKQLHDGINPDEAIAHGAALWANDLVGNPTRFVTEITPYSLGIEVKGDLTSVIIEKSSKIPCDKKKTFETSFDNQSVVGIRVHQGENSVGSENKTIGSFDLENIQLKKAGKVKIDVTFRINDNGILEVKAQEVSKQNSKLYVVEEKVV